MGVLGDPGASMQRLQAEEDVMAESGRNEGIGRAEAWTDWTRALLARQKAGNRIGVYASNETRMPNREGQREIADLDVETCREGNFSAK